MCFPRRIAHLGACPSVLSHDEDVTDWLKESTLGKNEIPRFTSYSVCFLFLNDLIWMSEIKWDRGGAFVPAACVDRTFPQA